MPFLNLFSDLLYSLMRLIAGFLFACHGAQKLFGVLGGPQMLHNPMMLAAGIIEFIGGVLIALGVFTTFAAFIASGEMAFAYFMGHAPHRFSRRRRLEPSPPSKRRTRLIDVGSAASVKRACAGSVRTA